MKYVYLDESTKGSFYLLIPKGMDGPGKKIFFGNDILTILDEDIGMNCKSLELTVNGQPTAVKTIFAAGGLVFNEFGEVLMIYRYWRWDLPKGQIKLPHETPEDQASCF